MKAEDFLPWHLPYWEILSAYIRQQRIPQALLLYGGEGLGKLRLALDFTQALLCEARRDDGRFCGRCHCCHLFLAGTHPDLLQLTPEEAGKAISVDQIRSLIAKLLLKPQFEGRRVAIIHPAEQMNRSAANAFLKCLEEPSERTSIILVSAKPFLLPATIASRCQKLHLGKPERQIALDWLWRQEARGDWATLLDLAGGAPLLAKAFAERQIMELRSTCFEIWLEVAKRRVQPSIAAEKWYNSSHPELLSWLISWTTDLIKYQQSAASSAMSSADLDKPLQDLAQRLDLKALFKFYDLLLRSKRLLLTTVNKQLLFEEILIHWLQLNSTPRHGRTSTETGHFVAVNQR